MTWGFLQKAERRLKTCARGDFSVCLHFLIVHCSRSSARTRSSQSIVHTFCNCTRSKLQSLRLLYGWFHPWPEFRSNPYTQYSKIFDDAKILGINRVDLIIKDSLITIAPSFIAGTKPASKSIAGQHVLNALTMRSMRGSETFLVSSPLFVLS